MPRHAAEQAKSFIANGPCPDQQLGQVLGNILLGIDGDTGLALMTKRLIEVGSKENAPGPPAGHTAKTLARDDRNKELSAHPSTGSDERLSKRSRSKFFSSL